MEMTFFDQDAVIQEMKGMLALHEACGDQVGKLTCLSTLGHHYLNVGRFCDALECFRRLFKELINYRINSTSLLELTAVAAEGFATTLRYKGYLEVSLYYYLTALESYLRLGRHRAALKEYCLLQYLSFRHPMQQVLKDRLKGARNHFLKCLTCRNDLFKMETLLEVLWKRQQVTTSVLLWQKRQKRKLNLVKEVLLRLLRDVRAVMKNQDLDKELMTIVLCFHIELTLLVRLQDPLNGDFMKVDDLLEMIDELKKHSAQDFLKAQHDLLASKIAVLGGLVEPAFDFFNNAIYFARSLGYKELLSIQFEELQRLREAVDMITVASRPTRNFTLNLFNVTRIFPFIKSLEFGLLTSYLETTEPLSQSNAASFVRVLDEGRKKCGATSMLKY